MKIAIIEDEILTAEDLKDILLYIDPTLEVVAMLGSVSEAITYFETHTPPQLIFSDIQLGDGLSFEIFHALSIKSPIIFCTAFDEYAIKAFNANGIHYVLKPFSVQKIKEALDRYYSLQENFIQQAQSINKIIAEIKQANEQVQPTKKSTSILVYYQNKIIPIKLEDVALFYVKNETTHLFTFDNRTYVVNKSLDELQQLDTNTFFRANRQFIVSRHAIKEATHFQARKLSLALNLKFPETITISKEKASQFFDWLSGSNT
jgi:two-component system response regulator LytT